MVGLPGDTLEKDIFSAKETVKIAPQLARLYPTVVLRDTALYDAYRSGTYTPLAEAEAVERTKAMYEILDSAGINIIRVGLKSSDIMAGETAFHPAFRQLVEGSIARDRLEMQLAALPQPCRAVVFSANTRSYNNLFGHRACNRAYFAEKYPNIAIRYACDDSLSDGIYRVTPAAPSET